MATLYLLDLNASIYGDSSDDHLSSSCPYSFLLLAELLRWGSSTTASEGGPLDTSTLGSLFHHYRQYYSQLQTNPSDENNNHNNNNNSDKEIYNVLPFPEAATVINKYFSTQINFSIGMFHSPYAYYNEHHLVDYQSCIINAIRNNNNNNNKPFGVVLILSRYNYDNHSEWLRHFPFSEVLDGSSQKNGNKSLVNILVIVEDETKAKDSHLAEKKGNNNNNNNKELEELLLDHHFETVLHSPFYVSTPNNNDNNNNHNPLSIVLEPVKEYSEFKKIGLLYPEEIKGANRILQLLTNTPWASSVPPSSSSRLPPLTSAKNVFFLISSQKGCRSFFSNTREEEGGNVLCSRGGQNGKGGKNRTTRKKKERNNYYACLLSSSTNEKLERKSHYDVNKDNNNNNNNNNNISNNAELERLFHPLLTEEEAKGPHSSPRYLLANKYFTTVVSSVVLSPLLFYFNTHYKNNNNNNNNLSFYTELAQKRIQEVQEILLQTMENAKRENEREVLCYLTWPLFPSDPNSSDYPISFIPFMESVQHTFHSFSVHSSTPLALQLVVLLLSSAEGKTVPLSEEETNYCEEHFIEVLSPALDADTDPLEEEDMDERERLLETLHCHPWPYRMTYQTPHESVHNTLLVLAFDSDEWVEESYFDRMIQQFQLKGGKNAISVPSLLNHITYSENNKNNNNKSGSISPHSIQVSNPYFNATVDFIFSGGLYETFVAKTNLFDDMLRKKDKSSNTTVLSSSATTLMVSSSFLCEAVQEYIQGGKDGFHHHTAGVKKRNLIACLFLLQYRLSEDYYRQEALLTDNVQSSLYGGEEAKEEGMGIVYLTDSDPGEDTIASVEHLLDTLIALFQTQLDSLMDRFIPGGSRRSGDDDGSDGASSFLFFSDYSLMELVYAEKEEERNAGGMGRIREAVEQHCWKYQHPTKTKTTMRTNTSEEGEKNSKEKRETRKENEDKVLLWEVQAGDALHFCALPPHYLIDPRTLQSVPVKALQQHLERNKKGNSPSIPKEKESNTAAEVKYWFASMKEYGGRLGRERRAAQAEVLAQLLEEEEELC